jgi:hypothetical protein
MLEMTIVVHKVLGEDQEDIKIKFPELYHLKSNIILYDC